MLRRTLFPLLNIMKVFFDVDETLVHTERGAYCSHAKELPNCLDYFTVERPCAKRLISFARENFGAENVFLLSIGTKDYISGLNEMLGWKFDPENIFAREDLEKHTRVFPTEYGGQHHEVDPHIYASTSNVLIDNLPHRDNSVKINFIGIHSTCDTNYLTVRDYYGLVDEGCDEEFFNYVKDFLKFKKGVESKINLRLHHKS